MAAEATCGAARSPALTADGRLLFAARALRSFAFGWLSVIFALYLAKRGLSATASFAVFTATLVEDALVTMLLATVAARWGPARVMAATAPPLPFVLAGGLKIVYDLLRFFRFGGVQLPEPQPASVA